jgi:hypothetical protein
LRELPGQFPHLQPVPDYETAIAIMIAIKKTIRIHRDPILIAKSDPGSFW